MTKPAVTRQQYVFICGCVRKFRSPFPRPMDEVSCVLHGPTRITSNVTGYMVRCCDCKYCACFQELQYNANRAYLQHIIKYPSHSTEISYGDQIVCDNIVTSPLFNLDLSEAV